MRSRLLLAPSIVLACVACASSDTAGPRDEAGPSHASAVTTTVSTRERLELRLLETAGSFMSAAVSDTGRLPRVVIAYRLLLREPDAPATFRRLAREASPAGRLYALCGLREVDPPAFVAEAAALRGSTEEVPTLEGCSYRLMSVGALVDELLALAAEDPFLVDLRGNGTTWRQGRRDPTCAGRTAAEWLEELERCASLEQVIADLGRAPPDDGLRHRYAQAEPLEEREEAPFFPSAEDDPLQPFRGRIVGALVAIGPGDEPAGLDPYRRALGHPGAQVRLGALEALAWFGPWSRGAALNVGECLSSADYRVRSLAVRVLASIGREAAPARPALTRALARPDEEAEVLWDALCAMEDVGVDDAAVPVIAKLLAHPESEVRERAAEVLEELGSAAAAVLPALRSALRSQASELDGEWWPFVGAIHALGPEVAGVVLAEELLTADMVCRRDLAETLRELGAPAIPALEVAFQAASPESGERLEGLDGEARRLLLAGALVGPARAYAVALLALDGEEAAPHLAAALASDDPTLPAVAAPVLATLGGSGLAALADTPCATEVTARALQEGIESALGGEDTRGPMLEWLGRRDTLDPACVAALTAATSRWRNLRPSTDDLLATIDLLERAGEPGREALERILRNAGEETEVGRRTAAALRALDGR